MATKTKRPRLKALILALAGGLAVVSCAYPTPYQPASTASSRTGYSDEQIEQDRFRVSFRGNTLTSRETVERYLLYRAAELTVEQGFDHFILVNRDTETKTNTYGFPSSRRFSAGPWGYWSPYWRWYRPRLGWRSWDPFYDPFEDDFDYRTVQRYEAIAEIVSGRGPKPSDNVRAFDAREVLERLGPSIELPRER